MRKLDRAKASVGSLEQVVADVCDVALKCAEGGNLSSNNVQNDLDSYEGSSITYAY
jgi:hypothetical protein